MNAPSQQQMQEFSKRAKADLTICYLALPKITKWGLSLDHPRAEKLARGEMNRSKRNEWNQGISFESAEALAASKHTGDAKIDAISDQCKAALSEKSSANQ